MESIWGLFSWASLSAISPLKGLAKTLKHASWARGQDVHRLESAVNTHEPVATWSYMIWHVIICAVEKQKTKFGRVRNMANILFFLQFLWILDMHALNPLFPPLKSVIFVTLVCFWGAQLSRTNANSSTMNRLLNRISDRVTRAKFRREHWGTELGSAFLLDFFKTIHRNGSKLSKSPNEWLQNFKWILFQRLTSYHHPV